MSGGGDATVKKQLDFIWNVVPLTLAVAFLTYFVTVVGVIVAPFELPWRLIYGVVAFSLMFSVFRVRPVRVFVIRSIYRIPMLPKT